MRSSQNTHTHTNDDKSEPKQTPVKQVKDISENDSHFTSLLVSNKLGSRAIIDLCKSASEVVDLVCLLGVGVVL